jgi:hypothetical protein
MKRLGLLALFLTACPASAQFKLAPAVAVEAEDFTVIRGWKVIKNGHGNYMVDMIGFNHISGERVLGIDARDETAAAHADVVVPAAGKHRLWVRYEYPAFCETRFKVAVEQDGKTILEHVMGKKDSPRYSFGDVAPKAQYDPPWGPEGLCEEVVTVPDLKKGKARIHLKAEKQPQTPGVAANRNVDFVYLTSDADDAWLKHYKAKNTYYPIIDAVRDTRGARWEVRFTNKSDKPAAFRIVHVYNRLPWGYTDPADVKDVKPGAASAWVGMAGQDTTHSSMIQFTGPGAMEVEIRPAGSATVAKKLTGTGTTRVYLPPYPGKEDVPTTPEEAIDAILAHLKKHKAPGKTPTLPLCYGGWMPLGQDNEYGRKYAQLYAAMGFRSLHPAHSGDRFVENLKDAGVPLTKSWMVMGYRNPPTKANIQKAKADVGRRKLEKHLLFFDYGDEIAFAEWMGMMAEDEVAAAKEKGMKLLPQQVINSKWVAWLKTNRPKNNPKDYWLDAWGQINAANFRPDSSAKAAKEKPRLYVDSLLFYEETAIKFAANGAKAVKAEFGQDVLCGANYSCHPFYYPHSTMYVKWFRGGAADLGRHSEYFWQVAQDGPMINGYVAEHFRAGMRDNPKAVLRQYNMPHSPGNTDASFLRSAFSHVAHGAKMLDYFGVGLNESFTENHVDYRDKDRFKTIRDVNHCVGFVEDLLPKSKVVPSQVALLVSETTERWDYAGVAADMAGHNHFGPEFRKTRLHFHLDRVGLWKALTFLGATPDIVTEEDVIKKKLAGYEVLVLVGDHWPREMIPAVEAWVKAGGVALATAGAGQRDEYGEKYDDFHKLAGIKNVKTSMKDTFIRPRQELPYLKPLATATYQKWHFPCLATQETFEAGDGLKALVTIKDGKMPVVTSRTVGKGRVIYAAAHLGLAYLYSALQPPTVPDRGSRTHSVPTEFNQAVTLLLGETLKQAGVKNPVEASDEKGGGLFDFRLLEAPGGLIVPIANYEVKLGQKVTVKVHTTKKVTKASSAYHGELKAKAGDGVVEVTLPLGYGDVVRLDVAK